MSDEGDRIDRRKKLALQSMHSSLALEVKMATLTIRDFDDELKAALRVRAAQRGRSMEAEVREILRTVLTRPSSDQGMGTRIRQRFFDENAEIEPPPRVERPRAAEFGR
ncbi:plasmid stabilization protein [Mycolicibacter sp. MYC123]|uniref:Plasmid stabilization protein n=2 Tax=[Mycobacterium] zoologicum TaxID=2872311 RepID=A0ABU5YK90_9MYCO|nr:plasmid stabilization protein [Mycolicibacter sp. MYC123]